ncbi:small multidrug resistance pump [Parapedobacter composti]|uniref:Small multidrug resistance pump n=2 Tax=Parapedobacter composti TaxID=623281 RepID=A0A1I1MZD2_9SPHI|nr:small multidrug resistance pump [Parapedobacter composti]
MSLGIEYGTWAALGISILAILGILLFKESLTLPQIIGIVLIIGGVLALELGKAAH